MQIVPITAAHALVFKAVRLRALQESPTAFGSTYAQESQLSDEAWIERVKAWGMTQAGYLAMEGDDARGMIAVFPEEQEPWRAQIVSMWVAPECRGTGLGRALIDTVKAYAAARGYRELRLHVTSNNARAIRFYLRNGFGKTGRTEPYPNDPALFEYEMAYRLA